MKTMKACSKRRIDDSIARHVYGITGMSLNLKALNIVVLMTAQHAGCGWHSSDLGAGYCYSHHDSMCVIAYQRQHSMMVMTGIPMMSCLNYYSRHNSMCVIAYQREHSIMVMTVIPILSYLNCYSHHGQSSMSPIRHRDRPQSQVLGCI